MLGQHYAQVLVVGIAAFEESDSTFSQDTRIPEVMVIARRRKPGEKATVTVPSSPWRDGGWTRRTLPGCEKPPKICPGCREGVLVPRTGRTEFWGCSRYQAEPSCRYTAPRKVEASAAARTPRIRP